MLGVVFASVRKCPAVGVCEASRGSVIIGYLAPWPKGTKDARLVKRYNGVRASFDHLLTRASVPVSCQGREDGGPTAEYVVVGHCCESGDLLTCKSESASEIEPRPLEKAEIGQRPCRDVCVLSALKCVRILILRSKPRLSSRRIYIACAT